MRKKEINMVAIRRKNKKMMRQKYGKGIRLSDTDMLLKDYVEYAIVRPLLKMGKVQIDTMIVEIVGIPIHKHKIAGPLAAKGLTFSGGVVKPMVKVNKNRPGILYAIKVTDTAYKKGKLVFEPCEALKKRVTEHLNNSFQYYRIVA